MDKKSVDLLIREGEGLTVELKERYTSRMDQDLVAFANTRGGTLILGVADDGKVTGETLTNELKARINSLARNCTPSIPVECAQAGVVVAVTVAEGAEKPYSCANGYFRRLNGSTQKMTPAELRVMFRQSEANPFEQRTVRGFTFDDVSRAKVTAFTKEAGISIGRTKTPDFLRSLGVADGEKVCNAGILFFARDVRAHILHAQMTLVAFKGTEKRHIYDRRDVRDDLLTQLKEAEQFLKRHLNVRSEIKGFDRKDICELPPDALREALVNALMHRDYSIRGSQINVEVYDDRVEVVNPGGLPEDLPPASFGKMSIRRNELISDLFFRVHKVERMGMGIKRMREAMLEAGLEEPIFETRGWFRAVFGRSPEFAMKHRVAGGGERVGEQVGEEVGKRVGDKDARGLTGNQRQILNLIATNQRIAATALSLKVGISRRKIEANLAKLKSMGLLRRVGPARGGHWEVITPASPDR